MSWTWGAVWLFLALGCAACTTLTQANWRDRAVGARYSAVDLMGEQTTELLTLHADGSFDAQRVFTNAVGMQARLQQHGRWRVTGDELEMVATAQEPMAEGADPAPPPAQPDRRIFKRLDDAELVLADKKFGIELRRARVPAGFQLPE